MVPTARSSCSSTGYPDPERPDDLAALELSPRNPGDADLELASAPLRRRTDRRRFSTWDVPEAMQTALMQRAAEQGALLRVITGRARRTLGNDTARCRHSARQHAPYQTETALWTGVEWIDDGIPSANLLAVPPDPAHGRRFTPGRIEQERSDEPDGALLVVVHAHEFPGGRENVAGMLHHFRFVRDHHRAVRRVALAADGTVADLAPPAWPSTSSAPKSSASTTTSSTTPSLGWPSRRTGLPASAKGSCGPCARRRRQEDSSVTGRLP